MRRWTLLLPLAIAAVASCAVGEEEEPGCHRDADCDGGTCRNGACFKVTFGQSPPVDPPGDDAGSTDSSSDGGDGEAGE